MFARRSPSVPEWKDCLVNVKENIFNFSPSMLTLFICATRLKQKARNFFLVCVFLLLKLFFFLLFCLFFFFCTILVCAVIEYVRASPSHSLQFDGNIQLNFMIETSKNVVSIWYWRYQHISEHITFWFLKDNFGSMRIYFDVQKKWLCRFSFFELRVNGKWFGKFPFLSLFFFLSFFWCCGVGGYK